MKFLRVAAPDSDWRFNFGSRESAIRDCVIGAFMLYDAEWQGFDIRKWEWPLTMLQESGSRGFNGIEPWAVLFKAAVAEIEEMVSTGA